MAALQNFRGAINGFNREDVVHYIEYINNLHTSELAQLRSELEALNAELDAMREQNREAKALQGTLEAEQLRSAQLQQELEEARHELAQAQNAAAQAQANLELEAYRRAERNERIAAERVKGLYDQANGILADATVRVDDSSQRITQLADQAAVLLAQLQSAVLEGKTTMQDITAALGAIRPVASEE